MSALPHDDEQRPGGGRRAPRSRRPRAEAVDRRPRGGRAGHRARLDGGSDFADSDWEHPDTRPRMRGWLHLFAFFGAIVAGGRADPAGRGARARGPASRSRVYCLTICGLFGVSALYHRRRWSPRGWKIMKRLDHSMIFLFIAGTYTPFALLAVDQPTGYWVLAGVWAGARSAASSSSSAGRPRRAGWACRSTSGSAGSPSSCSPTSCTSPGSPSLVLLAVGGLLYTRRRHRLRDQEAQPVAGHLRLPRGLPRDDDRGGDLPLHRRLLRDVQLAVRLIRPGITASRSRPDLRRAPPVVLGRTLRRLGSGSFDGLVDGAH